MNFRAPPASRRGLRDWTDLIFKDHGFLRIWWHNFHEVAHLEHFETIRKPNNLDKYEQPFFTILQMNKLQWH